MKAPARSRARLCQKSARDDTQHKARRPSFRRNSIGAVDVRRGATCYSSSAERTSVHVVTMKAAAPAASVITVDAGGRLFRTTRYTLLMSGAKYFEALFGPTGTILNGSPSSSWRENYDPGVDERGMFDSSSDDGDGENTPIAQEREIKEIFIDRDPELFADVLEHFGEDSGL